MGGRSYSNNSDYIKFSEYRAIFKEKCEKCFKEYMISVEDNITTNIKYFWTYIANRKTKSNIPSSMIYHNNKSSDPETICNMFSDFFKLVFEPTSPTLGHWEQPLNSSNYCVPLASLIFEEENVLRELKLLDPSKGPGPDGIPPCFLKSSSVSICKPLTIIYNKCLSNGVFPDVWKRAYITPVHKGGPKHDIEQYRPISILSTLSKLFERRDLSNPA